MRLIIRCMKTDTFIDCAPYNPIKYGTAQNVKWHINTNEISLYILPFGQVYSLTSTFNVKKYPNATAQCAVNQINE